MKKWMGILIALAMVVSVMHPMTGTAYTNAAVHLSGQTKALSFGQSFYGKHGRLRVKGTKLVDKQGQAVQLQGVSSHGINWDVGQPFVNEAAMQTLRDKWGVNCFRVAMYTEEYNGYCVTDAASRKKLLQTIDTAVKAGKKLGMYVIIDWHILSDGNPKKHQKQAKSFFQKMTKKYKKYNHVIYEICNEPNGGADWGTIKSYAGAVIKTIRKKDKNAVIIVGTPTWSQDVDVAAASPLKGKNIMYAIHFYAATHGDALRQKVKTALAKGLPLFCSEFSACEASGNGRLDFASAQEWMNLFDQNQVSTCCWSLSNKAETCSLLKPECQKKSGFQDDDLSEMGKWLVKQYR